MSVAEPKIIVHGGAWDIPPGERAAHRTGCAIAADAGFRVLAAGGSALDAVEAAVVTLEEDATFDAGRGSFLNAAGRVEMDAGLMTGTDLGSGAVASVTHVRNPIRLARAVLGSDHAMLVGHGTRQFAVEHDVELCEPEALVTPAARARWAASEGVPMSTREFFSVPRGTVGAVARDAAGAIVAGTSTGGSPGKPPGRVGDSCIVGAGVYANDALAGISATGWGEAIVRLVWGFRATAFIDLGHTAQEACTKALDLLAPLGARAGLIMIDRDGRIGSAFNTSAMAVAWRTRTGAGSSV